MLIRLSDAIFSFILIVLLFPIFVLVSILIRLSSTGPLFFKQERIGRYQKKFIIYKFRTMTHLKHKKRIFITPESDDRITSLGSILRKLKIDEIPQLFNILKGEMSFVGPRPEVEKYLLTLPNNIREEILSFKPGLTDISSIIFRNEGSILDKKKDKEIYYIKRILPKKVYYSLKQSRKLNFIEYIKTIFLTIVVLTPTLNLISYMYNRKHKN